MSDISLTIHHVRIMRFNGVRILKGYVQFSELAGKLDDHRDLNVRDPKMTTDISKLLISEAQSNPDFHLNNSGITCVADAVKKSDINKKRSKLEISFGKNGGLINGGHTYRAISVSVEEAMKDKTLERNPILMTNLVSIEFYTGLSKERITQMIEGRNTSLQVTPYCFDHLRGLWANIENHSVFADQIAFKTDQTISAEFDDNAIIEDKYFRDGLRPIQLDIPLRILMHASGKGLEFGKQNIVNFYRLPEQSNFLQSFRGIMDSCFRLYDDIYFYIEENFKNRIKKKWGLSRPVNSLFYRNTRPYSYAIPRHVIFALLTGISAVIDEEKGQKVFRDNIDIKDLLQSQEFYSMVDAVFNKVLKTGNEPSRVMHDKDFLMSLRDKVELWHFRHVKAA